MGTVNIQFADDTQAVIIGAFAMPQPGLSNTGTVDSSDARYIAFLAGTPTQQLAAQISAGCQIVSTGSPGLNGTYALDTNSRSNVQAEALFIMVNGGFTTQQPTMAWYDQAGQPHMFSSTTDFMNFSKALAVYFTALNTAAGSGQVPITWPGQPVTIA